MKRILFVIRNIITIALGCCVALIVTVPLVIIASLPAKWRFNSRIYYFFVEFFYKGLASATLLPVVVEGRENLLQQPSIIIANHQSALDIPMLGSLLDMHPHVWLFLARYARVPIFGFVTRRMNVVVDPSGLRRLVGSLHESLNIAKLHNSHIILFPEGGRYVDGTIHKFFYGFAIIAKATQRPVIPVVMHGIGKALPPRSLFVRYNPIKIVIGKPICFTQEHTEEDIVNTMHEWFVRNYQE